MSIDPVEMLDLRNDLGQLGDRGICIHLQAAPELTFMLPLHAGAQIAARQRLEHSARAGDAGLAGRHDLIHAADHRRGTYSGTPSRRLAPRNLPLVAASHQSLQLHVDGEQIFLASAAARVQIRFLSREFRHVASKVASSMILQHADQQQGGLEMAIHEFVAHLGKFAVRTRQHRCIDAVVDVASLMLDRHRGLRGNHGIDAPGHRGKGGHETLRVAGSTVGPLPTNHRRRFSPRNRAQVRGSPRNGVHETRRRSSATAM